MCELRLHSVQLDFRFLYVCVCVCFFRSLVHLQKNNKIYRRLLNTFAFILFRQS